MKISTIKRTSFYILGILFIILVWVFASIIVNNDIIIPSFKSVSESLLNLLKEGSTYLSILNTIIKLVVVLIVSVVLAFILAMISYRFEWFSSFVTPVITLLRTIPVATISIILLLMIGNKRAPYFICSLVVLPILYESFLASLKGISKGIIEETKMLSNVTPYIIYKVYLPIIGPYLISSIIASLGLGLKVMVMAEFISQTPKTIGYSLNEEKMFLEIDNVFAWTIILILFMLIVEFVLKFVQKKMAEKF